MKTANGKLEIGKRYLVTDAGAFNKVAYGSPTQKLEEGDVIEHTGINKNWGNNPTFKLMSVSHVDGPESNIPTVDTTYKAKNASPANLGLEALSSPKP